MRDPRDAAPARWMALKLAIGLFCRQRLSGFRVGRHSFLQAVRNRSRRDGAMMLGAMIFGAIGRGAAGMRKGAARAIRPGAFVLACGLALGSAFGLSSPAWAADIAEGPPPTAPEGGVACSIGQPFWVPSRETAETLPWPAVYLGHFSGGRPSRRFRTDLDRLARRICLLPDERAMPRLGARFVQGLSSAGRLSHLPFAALTPSWTQRRRADPLGGPEAVREIFDVRCV